MEIVDIWFVLSGPIYCFQRLYTLLLLFKNNSWNPLTDNSAKTNIITQLKLLTIQFSDNTSLLAVQYDSQNEVCRRIPKFVLFPVEGEKSPSTKATLEKTGSNPPKKLISSLKRVLNGLHAVANPLPLPAKDRDSISTFLLELLLQGTILWNT